MSPTNQVKSEADEQRWNECKKSVHAAHPKMKESNDRFWAMVNGCYQRRKGTLSTGESK